MYIIYTKPNCGYCDAAKRLLKKHEFDYEERIIGKDVLREDVIARFPERKTVPIITYNDALVGGYDDLKLILEVKHD